MTNTEIDRKLALAIGYLPEHIRVDVDCVKVYRPVSQHQLKSNEYHRWCWFDHLHWHIIGPIAAKYKCFPIASLNGRWWTDTSDMKRDGYGIHEVPQTAIALAVIDGAGL